MAPVVRLVPVMAALRSSLGASPGSWVGLGLGLAAGLSLALGLLLVAPGVSAIADGLGAADCAPCPPAPSGNRTRVREASTRGYRSRSRATSWSELRRHLDRVEWSDHHRHAAYFFSPRYPVRAEGAAEGSAAYGWAGLACVGEHEAPHECDLVMTALDPGAEAQPSGVAERLARGLERFYRGDFEGAREDLAYVAEAAPQDPRPGLGLLCCAFLRKDWRAAVETMRKLAALDALDPRDELPLEEILEEPAKFRRIRDGLASWARWNFTDADAQTAVGWAYAVTGEPQKARGHLIGALRYRKDDPIARHLLAALDEPPPER